MNEIYGTDEIDIRNLFDRLEETETVKLKKENICHKCDTDIYLIDDTTQGIKICSNCGEIISQLVDENPEWRNYEDDTKNNVGRCSSVINELLPRSSLGTNIVGGSFGNKIRKLHNWNAMPYRERSLHIVFKEIQAKCASKSIMKCIEDDAKIMYKTISECKHTKGVNKGKNIIIRGGNRKSMIAACVFYACKKKGMTRSPKEIADLFGIKYTEMTKGCRNFVKLVKLKKIESNMMISLPEHFVTRFCNNLHLNEKYAIQSIEICKNITKLNLASHHTPFSVAIVSILMMIEHNKLPITKKRIAEYFEVSEVTIGKTYKKIEKYAPILFNTNLTDKIIEEGKQRMIPKNVLERMKKFNVDACKILNENNIFNSENYKDIVGIDLQQDIDNTILNTTKTLDDFYEKHKSLY